jgi:leader peptidase (prepilin peptidase)/N-methyltransferase
MLVAQFICGGLIGAALGSYLGSAWWRIPNRIPLNGRSVCPGCGAPVPAKANVPVFAFLALRGKAACCGSPLSRAYLVLELAGVSAGTTVTGLFGFYGLMTLAFLVVAGSLGAKAVVDRT